MRTPVLVTYLFWVDSMLQREVKAVGWFLGAYAVCNALLYTVAVFRGDVLEIYVSSWSSLAIFVVFFVVQECIIVVGGGYIWKYVMQQSWKDLWVVLQSRRQRKGRGYVSTWVVGMLFLYFTLSVLLLGMITFFSRDVPGLYGDQVVMTLLAGLDMNLRREYIVVGLLVVIIGPAIEELVFRGIVTHSFMHQRAYQGVVLAALVFAAVHGERAVVRNLVILSLFLGTIYWKTGSIWYSFLFHMSINGLAFSVLVLSQWYPEMLG